MTLIVNLFGAPGVGKSTTATGVFSKLKLAGVNAEYVPEVAKDFTWEERQRSLTFQPYVHAKQLRNTERLISKVDVIVTDSPPLLSSFYAWYYDLPYPESFHTWVADCHSKHLQPAVNYYLRRVKPYNPAGRNQSEDEAKKVAEAMEKFLFERAEEYSIPVIILPGNEDAIQIVYEQTIGRLARGKAA